MKLLVILFPIITLVVAQRGSYAGTRPIGQPVLASRFRNPESTTVAVENRLGEGTQAKLPVDARDDANLVQRLNEWPRENRPFWLLNAEQIEAHRSQQPSIDLESRFTGSETIPAKPTVPKSPFAGSSRF